MAYRNIDSAVLSNSWHQWLVAATWGTGWFAFTMVYHDLWRGKPYSWLTTNECLALASVLCMCFALAVGPMFRFGWVGEYIRTLRRPMGIVSFILAALHVIVALVPMWSEFGLKWIVRHPLSMALAIVATIHMAFLTWISWPSAHKRMGYKRWKAWQRTAWIALAASMAHFLVLGKEAKWVEWFEKRPVPAPSFTLVLTILTALVFAVRAFDWRARIQSDCASSHRSGDA
ncbi:MAG: ferric reductase-like transmembrane domain-containing protein [Planctomycetota bacterium]|nr:ferric reductase-like transmembrane domain-containing protein [Planctomycetota bacterium]